MSEHPPRTRAPAAPTSDAAPTDEARAGLYGRAVRQYWWLVVLAGLVAALVGLRAASGQDETYEATAQIGLSPLPQYDPTFAGVDVIRQVGDVTQMSETVAALFEAPEFAEAAAQRLRPRRSPGEVATAVNVTPLGQSNVLRVTAEDPDPLRAQETATAYAEATVAVRRARFLGSVRERIALLEARKRRLPADDYGTQNDLGAKLNTLTALEAQKTDPTVFLGSPATSAEPASVLPASRAVGLATLVGLLLGSFAALGLALAGRALSSGQEAAALSGLPVLARLPRGSLLGGRSGPITPGRGGGEAWEAHRALAAQLSGRGGARAFAVVSASRRDGRTSTAAGLAFALADMGASVILVELDAANPRLAGAVGAVPAPPSDLSDRLTGTLAESRLARGVRVLRPSDEDAGFGEPVLRRLADVLLDARSGADYVIVDTPPYEEVSDALWIAPSVDEVVVVVRPGTTDRRAFGDLLRALEQTGASVAGMVLVGQGRQRAPSLRSRAVDDRSATERAALTPTR